MKKYIIVLILFCTISLSGYETLPTYHWAYDDIFYLKNRNLFNEIDLAIRPIKRIDVAREILNSCTMNSAELIAQERWACERLASEFSYEIAQLQKYASADLKFKMRSVSDVKLLEDLANRNEFLFRENLQGKFRFNLNNNLTLLTSAVLDQNVQDDPSYDGSTRWGLGMYAQEAYINYGRKHTDFKFGRDFLVWGQAKNDNLLLSDNALPLNQFNFNLHYKWLHLNYFLATLDDYQDVDRFMAGTRLQFNVLSNTLVIAANQINLWTGNDRYLEFAFANPLLFTYFEHFNNNGQTNTFYSLDMAYYTPWKNKIYFELLLDDFQYEQKSVSDLEPNEIGFTVGLDNSYIPFVPGLNINLFYTRVTNRTYNTLDASERFIHKGKCLGHSLENDFDQIYIDMSRYHLSWLETKGVFKYTRHGEGGLDQEFDRPWSEYTVAQGYAEAFPYGVVEKKYSGLVEINFHPFKYARIGTSFELEHTTNHNNVEDSTGWDYEALLSVELNLDYILKL
ncbi:MAG: capsule assembly Wzi family protein [Pseudomonadota bacterium]